MRHNYGKYISLIVFFTAFVNGIYCDKLKNHSVGFKHIGFNSQVMKGERSGNERGTCECGEHATCTFDESNRKQCACKEGYSPKKDKTCDESECGENATCTFDDRDTKQCACEEGYSPKKDKSCAECECGEHAICTFDDSDRKQCACEEGYSPKKDKTCAACECGEHATCTFDDSDIKQCACEEGYSPKKDKTCAECECGEHANSTFDNSDIKQCACKEGYSPKKDKTCAECECGEHATCTFDDSDTKQCACEEGYSPKKDKTCAECECGDHATCTFDDSDRKQCACEEGYSPKKDKSCAACECGEHATCTFDDSDIKQCACEEGYSPKKDKTCADPCNASPCQNDGKCHVTKEGFRCDCKHPYSGDQCEIDPCSTNPCQNGGKCHVTDEGLKCDCKHPYSGDKCEIDPCFTNPCKKGNTCKVNDGKMMCECNSPYEGIFCQAEADRCALLLAKGECNKEHETCYEGTCKCEKSYAYSKDGKACEADICGKKSGIAVCPENAECNEITNGYECACKKGFYQNGANCEKINPCSPGVSTCEQFCSPKDGKCACGDEFTLNKDNTTCKRKKSDDGCLKNCGKGTCFKKNGEEDCICPNATHVRGDTGCEDYCTHESKSPPGMCPGDKCIPDEMFVFRCDCKDPYEMAEDGIHCKRKAMCRSGGGHAACSKENAKCQEDFADEHLGYKCVCDTGFVKADNGTCVNACDLKNCEASRARCELNGKYEAVCKCPLLMTMGTDGMCTIVDNSYIAKLKVLKRKYEMHVERKQSKRSLEDTDTVDYAKLRGDFELSLKNVFSDYRDLKLLNCTDEGKELECDLELQFKKAVSKNTINLIFQPSVCIPLEDTSYCWIKPNLIVQIGKPEEVFHVTNPCTEEIQKLCGPVASCKQVKNTSSFQCLCKDGFKSINTFHLTSLSTIEICEDIDECQEQTSCPNNTECFNIFGSYDCQCKQGYRPTETKSIKESGCIAVCDPNPCKHGECVQFGNHGFLCSCDEEYGGAFCNSTNELVKKVKKSGVTKAAVVGVVLGLILAVVLIGGYMYFRTDKKESHEYIPNANQNVFPYMRGRDSSGRNLSNAAQNSGHMGADSGQRDTMRNKLRRSLDKSKLVPNVRWSRHSDGEYTEIIDGIVEGDIENQNRSFSKSSDHLGK